MIDFSLIKIIPADNSHYEFLFKAKKEAYGYIIERVWGDWDEKIQREFFAEDWQKLKPSVILNDTQPIGSYCCTKNKDNYFLERFYILPEYQNKGIGTLVLKRILEAADKDQLPVKLMYLDFNPAATLYERLGFEVTGRQEIKGKQECFVMTERKPSLDNKGNKS